MGGAGVDLELLDTAWIGIEHFDFKSAGTGHDFAAQWHAADKCRDIAGERIHLFGDVADIGAIVTKSIMMHPRAGRATPRMAETEGGIIQSASWTARASSAVVSISTFTCCHLC